HVCHGALLQCSFGMAPSSLSVLPVSRVMSGGVPAANIADHKPLVNVLPFGMCSSLANPVVVAATAAKLGVLTPMPCVPATPAPWLPGSPTVQLAGQPSLHNSCKLLCLWGGVIQITAPGQFTHTIA
ncbi:MAG: DUF4280 domain-containing protein, partial [Comamonas sp.]